MKRGAASEKVKRAGGRLFLFFFIFILINGRNAANGMDEDEDEENEEEVRLDAAPAMEIAPVS